MKRLLLAVVVVLAGCVRPSDNLDDSLAPIVRDGGADAGHADAGETFDAGHADAGDTLDAGSELDGGTEVDAGEPFDAGACVITWLATPAELAASPRANPAAELLALEGSETEFMVSDATYARALAEWTMITVLAPDAGVIPRNASGMIFTLDDAGAAAPTAGQFHEWDCLNWAYRGTPHAIGQWGFVEFAPLVNVDLLAPQYLSLPHIIAYEPNLFGVIDSAPDTCVRRDDDAGTWSWLGYTLVPDTDQFFRMTTERDGGATFERWPRDAGMPWPWLLENDYCKQRLWGVDGQTPPDGGP